MRESLLSYGFALGLLLTSATADARITLHQPHAPGESQHHPGLRDFETDRPDKTESTVTVDEGHWQLETEIASFTHSNKQPDLISFGSSELRYGLTSVLDVQVQFDPFVTELAGGGAPKTSQGFRDTTIRLKWNIAGNDGMKPGIALLPYFKIPTAQENLGNRAGEGGMLIPMKLILPEETELAFEIGVGAKRNDANTETNVQVISSYSLGHRIITDDFHVYVEYYSESTPHDEWLATIDTGFTYQIGADMQADLGVNIGMTPSADPWNPFIGYSIRF